MSDAPGRGDEREVESAVEREIGREANEVRQKFCGETCHDGHSQRAS